MLSAAGRRQHGGNAGCEDDPAGAYRYDSSVGNSANVSRGDLVAIRNREGLLAVGLVDSITVGAGTKTRFRCPVCRITTIKQRQNMAPAWRCRSGQTFDAPNTETIDVTTYAADYTRGQVLLNGHPDAAAARATAMRPSTQNSIQEIDAAALARLVIASRPDTRPVFERFYQSWPADIFPSTMQILTTNHHQRIAGSASCEQSASVAVRQNSGAILPNAIDVAPLT